MSSEQVIVLVGFFVLGSLLGDLMVSWSEQRRKK